MKAKLQTQNKEEFKETELGLLPKDWDVVKLGNKQLFDILPSGIKIFNGKKEYLSTESIQLNKIIKIECLIDFKNRPSRANMQPLINSVWFAKMKNTNKVYSFTENNKDEIERYILSTGFCGILCKREIDPTFLRMIFISDYFNKLKDKLSHGTTQQAVNTDDINSIILPLPPLPEQQKIAYVLSIVQNAKEKTERLINSLKELKKSTMKHLFTYGAVSFEDADKVKLKDTEIGKVPKDWDVEKMIDVATFQRGKDLPKQQRVFGEIPVIGSGGIIGYHNQYMCDGQGIITGRSGSIGTLTYFEGKYWAHNTGLYIKDFHGNNPKFIYYLLQLFDFKRYSTGVSVPTLNRNFIHSELIKVPSLPEQQQIAAILSSIDKRIETEEQKKNALEQLFKSLLNNLMIGKIRVKDLQMKEVKNVKGL